jgi:MFS superfamily sulfate permease-like transporter
MNALDSTGLRTLEEVQRHLAERGVAFGLADLNSGSRQVVDRAGLGDRMGKDMIFPSAEAALTTFEALADHK